MNEKHRYAFVLGTHPKLSTLEIERLLRVDENEHIQVERQEQIAMVTSTEPLDAAVLMSKLGGTIKIVQMVGEFDPEQLSDWLIDRINTDTKFNFGFSVYMAGPGVSLKKDLNTIRTLGLQLKKALKSQEISCRFVESKEVALSSVIVHKERLLKNGVDVVLLKRAEGMEFGFTLAVQPFQEFSKRDYGRPSRDHRSGMLPPKVARIMVNIARPEKGEALLDPFCGSGTVLQEAALLGETRLMGTDISSKAIQDTRDNLAWLEIKGAELQIGDVTAIDKIIPKHSVQTIVAEGDLGSPKTRDVHHALEEARALYARAIPALANVLAPGGRIVLALPSWKQEKDILTLGLDSIIEQAGLKHFHEPLVYGRQGATVKRHIHFLTTA